MTKLSQLNDEIRSVSRVIDSIQTSEGEGFIVNRAFPNKFISDFDPFLLLDEMGPSNLGPREAKGAPDHPHRGFDTVTYVIAGYFEHKDSHGNSGKLGPGDVQWMTAGSGLIHSEMPQNNFLQTGGKLHLLQLWVNLPMRDKKIKPHYQDTRAEKIPIGRTSDGLVSVRVIAGEALGAHATIDTRTPITYLHLTIQPGGGIVHQVPKEFNTFAYVIGGGNGGGIFGSKEKNGDEKLAKRGQIVLFARDGDKVSIRNPMNADLPIDVLLIAGLPLNEPVAHYGPFVMNTQEEIYQAIDDYRNGRLDKLL
jgi:redox-sensitive bicupin YhaK (pirin superfamily)